jgi:hypothetical protein
MSLKKGHENKSLLRGEGRSGDGRKWQQ